MDGSRTCAHPTQRCHLLSMSCLALPQAAAGNGGKCPGCGKAHDGDQGPIRPGASFGLGCVYEMESMLRSRFGTQPLCVGLRCLALQSAGPQLDRHYAICNFRKKVWSCRARRVDDIEAYASCISFAKSEHCGGGTVQIQVYQCLFRAAWSFMRLLANAVGPMVDFAFVALLLPQLPSATGHGHGPARGS